MSSGDSGGDLYRVNKPGIEKQLDKGPQELGETNESRALLV